MTKPERAGNSLPQVFDFAEQSVRIEIIESQPWFIAKDVCLVLGIGKPNNVTRYLDEDEKGAFKVRTIKGMQTLSVVNESGLYSLIFRSNKPQAKAFRKWVTNEVLPQIRKEGSYNYLHPLQLLQKRMEELRKKRQVHKAYISTINKELSEIYKQPAICPTCGKLCKSTFALRSHTVMAHTDKNAKAVPALKAYNANKKQAAV